MKIWSLHLLDNLSNCLMNHWEQVNLLGSCFPVKGIVSGTVHENFSGSWDNCLNYPASARIISSFDDLIMMQISRSLRKPKRQPSCFPYEHERLLFNASGWTIDSILSRCKISRWCLAISFDRRNDYHFNWSSSSVRNKNHKFILEFWLTFVVFLWLGLR